MTRALLTAAAALALLLASPVVSYANFLVSLSIDDTCGATRQHCVASDLNVLICMPE